MKKRSERSKHYAGCSEVDKKFRPSGCRIAKI